MKGTSAGLYQWSATPDSRLPARNSSHGDTRSFMDKEGNGCKYAALKQQIGKRESMLIAYSGGVDSALLATVAKEVLGERTHCVFLDSPLVTRSAANGAERLGRELGLSFEIIREPVLNDTIRRNPPDRCYHCKKTDAQILKRRAFELGFSCVADGINLSDLHEHRPGIIASTEEGIVHPFLEAGITKGDIRNIARECGYDFWNKPSAACLSSRIPYGEEITDEGLRMIEAAEDFLHSKGFLQVRVRLHCGTARIEVENRDIPRIAAMREEIAKELRKLGIMYISLDLEGYRSGSMDEVLPGG
jgi:pyridinium-3,5-biscarboxylic acid mononucleotide sulfurtransferase